MFSRLGSVRQKIRIWLDECWPRICEGCEETMPLGGRGVLCDACRAKLVRHEFSHHLGARCAKCGHPFPGYGEAHETAAAHYAAVAARAEVLDDQARRLEELSGHMVACEPAPAAITNREGNEGRLCPLCMSGANAFDRARSAAPYVEPLRTWIHKLKYRKCREFAPELAALMCESYPLAFPDEHVDLVCPIPLHRSRQRLRGYNQADLLARIFARRMGFTYKRNLLRRTRATDTQTHYGAKDRRRNLMGAFVVDEPDEVLVHGRCIMVVDDVMTTGATLSAAAKALRDAGAARVIVYTLARD